MPTLPAAAPNHPIALNESALLRRYPTFRTSELEQARNYVGGVLAEHRLAYLPRERRLNFRHRQAKLGRLSVNSMQYGAGVMVTAPPLGFYLLQFTLAGTCEIWQNHDHIILPPGSVAVVNPFRPYRKAFLPGARQLLFRIERGVVEQEFRAWTGIDETARIEFELAPVCEATKVGTLWRYACMLCDDLRDEKSDLCHPLVRERIASGLASILLASMPHNRSIAVGTAVSPVAPYYVRRVERYIEHHAHDEIGLSDLADVAGVSARALQVGFRRFRSTTPMAYLRAVRMELARKELAGARQRHASVAKVANDLEFGNPGRFARDYRARFGELPSETLRRRR